MDYSGQTASSSSILRSFEVNHEQKSNTFSRIDRSLFRNELLLISPLLLLRLSICSDELEISAVLGA